MLGMLDFTRKKNNAPAESTDPKIKAADEKGKDFDSVQMMLKWDQRKGTPVQAVLTEHEKAAQKKRKLEEALNTEANATLQESGDEAVERKRDAKRKDKRELAIEKALMD